MARPKEEQLGKNLIIMLKVLQQAAVALVQFSRELILRKRRKKKQENYNKCVKDWEQSESGVEARGQFDKDMGDRGLKQDTTGSYCDPKDMENTTPGSLVGDAMGSAITTDTQWAANISSWVSALVNAVINRLMEKGLSEMSKSDPDAAPDYYPPEYADMRNSGYEQEKTADD